MISTTVTDCLTNNNNHNHFKNVLRRKKRGEIMQLHKQNYDHLTEYIGQQKKPVKMLV